MAQLSLFASASTRRPTASQAVHDAADPRPRPYRVPVYRVTLIRETAIPAPEPRLRSAHRPPSCSGSTSAPWTASTSWSSCWTQKCPHRAQHRLHREPHGQRGAYARSVQTRHPRQRRRHPLRPQPPQSVTLRPARRIAP